MTNKSVILLVILSLALPLILAHAGDGNEHQWNIRIHPVDDDSGKFVFDASLSRGSSSVDGASRDELRVPRMTIIPGRESKIEIKAPDGRPAVTARVLIAEDGKNLNYFVMIRTENDTHTSSANLDLSTNKAR